MSEQLLGEKHPDIAIILNDLAVLYVRMEQPMLALPLYERYEEYTYCASL